METDGAGDGKAKDLVRKKERIREEKRRREESGKKNPNSYLPT